MCKFYIVYFFIVIKLVKCDHYFTVTAPAILRAGNPYKFAVSSHNIGKEEIISLNVGLFGENKAGFRFEKYKTIHVKAFETKVAKIHVINTFDHN